jgi:tetratricopeptide (TPR) repeat protein
MGVVYEAWDRQRGARVALKTLRDLDANAIYYFKREFRSLADVVHPNLVQLHELYSVGDRWFFTMELVEGTDFLSYVRTRPDRLRPALRQLAEGVAALHATGKLHRDIKPSNALVCGDGRVVLLDFGLVTDLGATALYQTVAGPGLVGTPIYLAPEQAAAEGKLSPACDWYSVGVLLYEVLTGVPPFEGGLLEVLREKQRRDPPPPRMVVAAVPEDLDALCMALLARQPEDRPGDEEVLRRLGPDASRAAAGPGAAAAPPARTPAVVAVAPFLGRARHQRELADALDTVERGGPVVLFVHGSSGMGKTALVQRFLDEISHRAGAVVLAGRCYERELVPYRALDSLVDALARYLMALPLHEAEALLPRDPYQTLVRLFPVLRRADVLNVVGRKGVQPVEPTDPLDLRKRAFAALRELLGRIGDRKTLVLAVDDLQWGDEDSATLIRYILEPPDAPAALFLFCYRSEDAAASPCLAALGCEDGGGGRDGGPRDAGGAPDGPLGGPGGDRRELAVGPLDEEDARTLALALLADESPRARAAGEAIARECGGSPFFVEELVKHVRAGAGRDASGAAAGVTLEEVLRARIGRLDERTRALLEAFAVAGRPLAQEVAGRVVGLAAGGEEQPLGLLRSSHFIRARGNKEELEIAHDRIRVAAVAAMTGDRVRDTHRRLARVLASLSDVDPEQLALHLEGAGERARAGEEAARAAARADETLAFDRAARLYRWALSLSPGEVQAQPELHARLADALANLGRGAEAAEAYAAAADRAGAGEALELRRRAAEQLLRFGHLDQGLVVLRAVLRSLGVDLAKTPGRALASLLRRRARIRLRGLGFRARDPSQIAPQALTRLEVYWSVATGLGAIDNVRATDFQTRHLLLALQLGEPYRLARALASEAVYTALGGDRNRKRTVALLETARAMAERTGHPFARGWVTLAEGMSAYFEGRHREAEQRCAEAEAAFQGCTGVWWEIGSARLWSLWALLYLGQIREIGRRLPLYIRESEERGDRYTATNLRTGILNWFWLAEDDPDRADGEVDDAMRGWSTEGFHSQHFWHMLANGNVFLYRGDAAGARRRLDRDWGALSRSLVLRVQVGRIEAYDLRGRVALLAAQGASGSAGRSERKAHLASLDRNIRRLVREGTPWSTSLAALLSGGRAALLGAEEEALAALEGARRGFDEIGMAVHVAVASRRTGQLRGGEAGAKLVRDADAWLAAQGVKSPARVAATLAPGYG